jgi:hypothetical protein
MASRPVRGGAQDLGLGLAKYVLPAAYAGYKPKGKIPRHCICFSPAELEGKFCPVRVGVNQLRHRQGGKTCPPVRCYIAKSSNTDTEQKHDPDGKLAV